jgi:hypothetical protein
MEKLKIEKNVPLYDVKRGGKPAAESPYPLEDMVVGDSFLKRCDTSRDWSGYNYSYSHLRGHIDRFKKKSLKPIEFAVRTVIGGYRCWRVS